MASDQQGSYGPEAASRMIQQMQQLGMSPQTFQPPVLGMGTNQAISPIQLQALLAQQQANPSSMSLGNLMKMLGGGNSSAPTLGMQQSGSPDQYNWDAGSAGVASDPNAANFYQYGTSDPGAYGY